MGRSRNDILQGTLTLLLLQTLKSRGALHGYSLCQHIQNASSDLLRIEEGSLYPALHRMEQDGWLTATWEQTDKGRLAKVYSLTRRGRTQLAREKDSWNRLTRGVALVVTD